MSRINPTVRGFAIIILIAVGIWLLQLQTALVSLLLIARCEGRRRLGDLVDRHVAREKSGPLERLGLGRRGERRQGGGVGPPGLEGPGAGDDGPVPGSAGDPGDPGRPPALIERAQDFFFSDGNDFAGTQRCHPAPNPHGSY